MSALPIASTKCFSLKCESNYKEVQIDGIKLKCVWEHLKMEDREKVTDSGRERKSQIDGEKKKRKRERGKGREKGRRSQKERNEVKARKVVRKKRTEIVKG